MFFRSAAARTRALLSTASEKLRAVERSARLPQHSLPLVALLLFVLLGGAQLVLLTSRAASQQEERYQLLVSETDALQAVVRDMKRAEEEEGKTMRGMEAEERRLRAVVGAEWKAEGQEDGKASQEAIDRLAAAKKKLVEVRKAGGQNVGKVVEEVKKAGERVTVAVEVSLTEFGDAKKCFTDWGAGLRKGSAGPVSREDAAALVALASNMSSSLFVMEVDEAGAREKELEAVHAALEAVMRGVMEEVNSKGEKGVGKESKEALHALLVQAEEQCSAAAYAAKMEGDLLSGLDAALAKSAKEKSKGGKAGSGSSCPVTDCKADQAWMDDFLNVTRKDYCPADLQLSKLLLLGSPCACLQRRHCYALNMSQFQDPPPLPGSLWDSSALHDDNVVWEGRECGNFECLRNKKQPVMCASCFDLEQERDEWMGKQDAATGKRTGGWFESLAHVLNIKGGAVRIGLDVGGGTGSFAAAMASHNVVMMTIPPTALFPSSSPPSRSSKLDPPFAEVIAMRGLVPLELPLFARLPLLDNSLDIVHVDLQAQVGALPINELEALLFEWDRVLRPGGLLWMDMEVKQASRLPAMAALFPSFGYLTHIRNGDVSISSSSLTVRYSIVAEKPRQRDPSPVPASIRSLDTAT